MATNVTERNKTLQEIIEWCENSRSTLVKFLQQTHLLGIVGTTSCNGRIRAYEDVINHCESMLGSGSMPSEVSNQSEDTKAKEVKPMNDDQGQAVWSESIEKYGKETQSIVCMEECSELIQAISKRLRGKPDATDNLAEGMADVIICLYMLKEMYDITDAQLNEWIARKTARQSKRMQADDPFLEGKDAE